MKYQAIIFDMDGTIIATEHLWDKATKSLLDTHAPHLTQEEKSALDKHFKGFALHDAMHYLKTTFNLDTPLEHLIHEYSQCANNLYQEEVRFIDGFLSFHATLDSHNLKYGIATNADDLTLSTTKKALPLEKLFGEHIYNITHVNHQGKPKPDIYLYAARQLDVHPHACIAIEDSAHGIKAAKAAGMLCIGINSHDNPEQLTQADIVINAYHEIELAELLKVKPT